jgi:hypothetical protein
MGANAPPLPSAGLTQSAPVRKSVFVTDAVVSGRYKRDVLVSNVWDFKDEGAEYVAEQLTLYAVFWETSLLISMGIWTPVAFRGTFAVVWTGPTQIVTLRLPRLVTLELPEEGREIGSAPATQS